MNSKMLRRLFFASAYSAAMFGCSAMSPSRLELMKQADLAYEDRRDADAFKLLSQAENIPGEGYPQIVLTRLWLLKDALNGRGESSDKAIAALSTVDGADSYGLKSEEVGLYRQVALTAKGDIEGAKNSLAFICKFRKEKSIEDCSVALIRNYRTRAYGSKRRSEAEKFFIFSNAQYLRTKYPFYLGMTIDALGHVDLEKAVDLKEKATNKGHMDALARQQYCGMLADVSSNPSDWEKYGPLIAHEEKYCELTGRR